MPSESEALVIEYRGRSIHKKFNNRDKSRGKSRDKFNGRLRARKNVECFYCHEKGPMKRECRKLKREQQENGDVRQNSDKIDKLKTGMKKHSAMKDLGPSKHILDCSRALQYHAPYTPEAS
ncbi:hypothetical protein KIW84_035902 [Lathyrus oleraceus]|uniref:CCHC-type domain-containing protein n=1 Tax=Pisum sativum TaxID=3888 RepID=A0A9D4Y432_PEA|nr:hypothetical protein KIW84_035902 [Pisum sativum]